MEIGVFTFADVRRDPDSGEPVSAQRRLHELIEEVELAETVGLDVFGVGGQGIDDAHGMTSRWTSKLVR